MPSPPRSIPAARRRGFGLVEVLIAAVVMGLVLVALITSGGSLHRRAHVTEGHALAMVRARVLADMVRATDFPVLKTRAAASGAAIDLESFYEPGARTQLFSPLAPDAGTRRYLARLRGFEDDVRWTQLGPDLARIDVRVRWTDPLVTQPAPRHEIHLAVLMERPEMGFVRP